MSEIHFSEPGVELYLPLQTDLTEITDWHEQIRCPLTGQVLDFSNGNGKPATYGAQFLRLREPDKMPTYFVRDDWTVKEDDE